MHIYHGNIWCNEGEGEHGVTTNRDGGTQDHPEHVLAALVNQETKQRGRYGWYDVHKTETNKFDDNIYY